MGLPQTKVVSESGDASPEFGEAVQNASRDGLIADLYHANYAAVLRVCSGILRNPDDAADAAQEVFLIALESLDVTARRSAARAWLVTVARNHCLDLLRRRKRLGKAMVTLAPDADRGTDMETAVADRDFVDIVFKQLTRRERQALWHSAVESRPLAELAGRFRLSYMAAAQVLHRARRHALQVAARVAVVFGVFQLGRPRPGAGSALAATRLAAVAAVPLILVSLQSSSSAPPATLHPAPVTAGVPAPAGRPTTSGGAGENAVTAAQRQLPVGLPNSNSLLAGSTSTLNTATDAVRQLLRSLPTVPPELAKPAAAPSALPSLPPVP